MQVDVGFSFGGMVPQVHVVVVVQADTPADDFVFVECYEYFPVWAAADGSYLVFGWHESPEI